MERKLARKPFGDRTDCGMPSADRGVKTRFKLILLEERLIHRRLRTAEFGMQTCESQGLGLLASLEFQLSPQKEPQMRLESESLLHEIPLTPKDQNLL